MTPVSRGVPFNHRRPPIVARSSPAAEAPVIQIVPTVLLGLLVILSLPVWNWSRGWGWAPAGMLAMGLGSLVLFSFTVTPP
jgi:hypothetical protein